MPPRKKGKKANNYIVPKWTGDGFGSYSLVLETVNKPTSTTENKENNQPIFGRKTSKKPEQSNAVAQNLKDNQQIEEKFCEYFDQQIQLADTYGAGMVLGVSSSSEVSESDSQSETEQLNPVDDESDKEYEAISHQSSESAEIIDKSEQSDEDDTNSDIDSFNDFMNDHFECTPAQPIIVSAQTDSFPCDDDSEPIDKEVKFYIDKFRAAACADYDGTEYRIGFLDLTADERARMDMISQTEIYLTIKSNSIMVRDNRFHIKRIKEREIAPSSSIGRFDSKYDELKLARVQFSSTEPFFAKYDDEIYFVGELLYHEYSELLKQTRKCAGTAIRIGHDRLVIDIAKQTLDITNSIPFRNQKEICVINGSFDKYKFQDEYPLTSFQRVMICDKPWTVLEVEPELLHSSIYDDCTEIYADINFPIDDNDDNNATKIEKIVKPAKSQKKPAKAVPRYSSEEEQLEMTTLNSYAVPEDVKEFAGAMEKTRHRKKIFSTTKFGGLLNKKSLRTNMKDYINGSKLMLHLEEEAQAHYLKHFDQSDISITYHMDRQYYFPVTDNLIELAAAIEENVLDFFVLKPKTNSDVAAKHIYGQVYRVRDKKIYIEIFQPSIRLVRKANKSESYDICFILNRVPYQVQHYALHFVEKEQLFNKLINNSYYMCKTGKLTQANGVPSLRDHRFQKNGTMLEKMNAEQQKAVQNIIAKSDNLPFVLFGPPGTGKTRTLVATIEQIVRTTHQNVLVCAMSNAACDEITERLLDVLDETEMYRFYAKSYKHERISSRIKPVSNYSREGIFYPSLAFLYKFRVFISTLCSSGCLTRARADKEVWRATHFDYVFIDECASAHETMCLVPIAGVCTSHKQIHAKIILAGDPKQLDAVTRSDAARKLGYNTSWMERLCNETNLYQRKNGKYNELYIMQLVKNYRSHPEILRIPNELFYDNTLVAMAKEADINWYGKSNFMGSNGFPLIFKSVNGQCERSLEHSWFNDTEVNEVYNTIKQLLPPQSRKHGLKSITQSDIGVVTPYRKQRHKIIQKLRRYNLEDVTVGTAEIFQGKEKPIMIISTVRSDGKLGFVYEERRLNVVLTRAKTLVVIIGDPHTLKKDKNWFKVIEHCWNNGSFMQCNQRFMLR